MVDAMPEKLSIVIPAYNGKFLDNTLESIAKQTNRQFSLYIGDDCSKDDLRAIVMKYEKHLPVTYKRFDQNMGQDNLVQQWRRCVEMAQSEQWIWLFPDDDIMGPDCVEEFYKTLEETDGKYDLYRFGLQLIDRNGKPMYEFSECQKTESAFDFALARLKGQPYSMAGGFIFSKSAYDRNKGFVEFPAAWCSDDASFIRFGLRAGICRIDNAKVYWRMSGENITTQGAKYKTEKLEAVFQYLKWLNRQFEDTRMKPIQKEWVIRQIGMLNSTLSIQECRYAAREANKIWKDGFLNNFIRYFLLNIKLPGAFKGQEQ